MLNEAKQRNEVLGQAYETLQAEYLMLESQQYKPQGTYHNSHLASYSPLMSVSGSSGIKQLGIDLLGQWFDGTCYNTSTVALVTPAIVGIRNLTLSTDVRPNCLPKLSSVTSFSSLFSIPFARTVKVIFASIADSPKAVPIHPPFPEC